MLQGELKGKRIRAKVGPGSKNNTLSFDTNVPKAKMIKIVKDDLGYFVDESVDIKEKLPKDADAGDYVKDLENQMLHNSKESQIRRNRRWQSQHI
jgi:hypothetical protein